MWGFFRKSAGPRGNKIAGIKCGNFPFMLLVHLTYMQKLQGKLWEKFATFSVACSTFSHKNG